MSSLTAGTVRGTLGAADIEKMNTPAGALPPPPLPSLKKGEKCFRSTQGLRLLIKEIKDREVDGHVLLGERKWAEFKKHVSGTCFELVTSDKETVDVIEGQIEKTGGVLIWEAKEQLEQYHDTRAEQLAAELASNPDLRERVSAIGAERASFSLEPVKKAQA